MCNHRGMILGRGGKLTSPMRPVPLGMLRSHLDWLHCDCPGLYHRLLHHYNGACRVAIGIPQRSRHAPYSTERSRQKLGCPAGMLAH